MANQGVENKKDNNQKKGERVESLEKVERDSGQDQGMDNLDGADGQDYSDEISQKIEAKQKGPRFDFADAFFYIAMAVLSDLFDGLWITRFLFAPATLLWLYMKGLNNVISKNVIAQGVELIPAIGFLPISTIAAILTIWATNYPESFGKVFGIAGKIMQKTGKKK